MNHETLMEPAQELKPESRTEDQRQIVDLAIEGMTCASCVARVERSIRKVEGVEEVAVNLATSRARIRTRKGVELAKLQEQVERAGYLAAPVTTEESADAGDSQMKEYRSRFLVAVPFASAVFLLSMTPMIVPAFGEWAMRHMFQVNIAQFVLTTVLMLVSGRGFFTIAARNARHGVADMNTLIAVGTGAAYLLSAVVTFFHESLPGLDAHDIYFDTAAIVITLILMGRWMETRAKSHASGAIRSLMRLAPKVAHRVSIEDASRIEDVEVEFIRPGDLLLVKPGESVPVDGELVDGASAVDESMMTGEAIPVEKIIGSALIGGTINATGAFTMRATGVGDETMLAQIIRTVDEAQSSKAPVQRLADRIATVFVPVVIGIAAVTFLLWMLYSDAPLAIPFINAVAVLVIACPCALGLAVPTAIMAGTGNGAGRGILIRNAESLERAGDTQVVVFDKTGTLTHGRPEAVDVVTYNGFSRQEMLRLASSVEAHSEHPVAQSVVRRAEAEGIVASRVKEFTAAPGIGVYGKVDGRQVFVGRRTHVMGTDAIDYREPAGAGSVWVEVDGTLAGVIALADTVKPQSAETVDRLKGMGIDVVMLTGDNRIVAEEIARSIGIRNVIADVLPQDKGAVIEQLKRGGRRVAMVGDGVNDAPALALADVGIAMATGTDVAMSVADITLIGGDISRVPDAIALSRRTMKIIKQNLFWAFIYNIVGIPLAALGLLSPMFAGGAMAMSSVSVVSNSLRLKR